MEDVSLENNLAGYFFRVINESIERHSFEISEETRAYVVLVADRFFDSERFHVSSRPLTFRLAEAERRDDGLSKLQYIGDECLFLTGCFRPFIEKNGCGQVEYVSAIGSRAYKTVGEKKDLPVFFELAERFPQLREVLEDIYTIKPSGEFTDKEIQRLAKASESLKKEEIIFPEGLN